MTLSADKVDIPAIQHETADLNTIELLDWATRRFAGAVSFASSLGLEDQVLTDMIARNGFDIPVFTLDTGRLFRESYDLIESVRERYNLAIRVYFPDAAEVERLVNAWGVNLFRRSQTLRKRCCEVRKVIPLRRALAGHNAWVCGLRQEQSITRAGLSRVEWDPAHGLVKLSPLALWTEPQVRDYLREHDVPFNPLHDQGYPSVGCACCTRAIRPGEDPRAGRWWWEAPEHRECGLHVKRV